MLSYICKKCGKEMYSITETEEYWGETYCVRCVPETSKKTISAPNKIDNSKKIPITASREEILRRNPECIQKAKENDISIFQYCWILFRAIFGAGFIVFIVIWRVISGILIFGAVVTILVLVVGGMVYEVPDSQLYSAIIDASILAGILGGVFGLFVGVKEVKELLHKEIERLKNEPIK